MSEEIPTANGIYPGLPDSVYRAIPRLSNSVLKHGILEQGYTMAHLKAVVDGRRKKDTPALAFGRALHVRLLEPKKFKDQYAVIKDHNGSTKEGKAIRAAWKEANPGKEQIDETEERTIEAVVKSVKGHEEARRRVACVGGFEVSVLWTDPVTGIDMKCRLDKWIDGGKPLIVLDLKGMRSLATHDLQRDIYKYGYHVQAAIYIDAIKAITGHRPKFYFLFVEKQEPYAVRLVLLDDAAIKIGRATYQSVLAMWKECLRTGEYPAWGSNIETLELPAWALKQWETMDMEDVSV